MKYMKMINMTKYRLHRYFYSSRPVIPFIIVACFIEVMYSVRPMEVCSGFILSGVFQFILMTFVSLNMIGKEDVTEEQLLLLHGNSWAAYGMAREMTLVGISCFYGVLLTFGPVLVNAFNEFAFFTRPLTAGDVGMGACIILGSGFAGTAIGSFFHVRIINDRRIAIVMAVGMMILSIVKEAVVEKFGLLRLFGILLPDVMKPARDFGKEDFFEIRSVIVFLIMMTIYYVVVAVIKNLILSRKKFS